VHLKQDISINKNELQKTKHLYVLAELLLSSIEIPSSISSYQLLLVPLPQYASKQSTTFYLHSSSIILQLKQLKEITNLTGAVYEDTLVFKAYSKNHSTILYNSNHVRGCQVITSPTDVHTSNEFTKYPPKIFKKEGVKSVYIQVLS